MDYPLEFLKYQLIHKHLFSDQVLSLILRIVAVAESTIVSEFELEELMTELAFVPHVVPEVEFFAASPAATPTTVSFIP